MQKFFDRAHELGSQKFGGIWLMANRQAIRACEQVGLDYTDPQMKALLSLASLNILVNVQEAFRANREEGTK